MNTDGRTDKCFITGSTWQRVVFWTGLYVFYQQGEGTQEALKKFHVEAGVLAEWNGKEWKVVRRNQFVEVTGPGGIYGNTNPETDPILGNRLGL